MRIEKTITITQKDSDYFSELLFSTGTEIYNSHGLKRDETITRTCDFGNGIEADIKIVICDEDERPYAEGVLFKDGYQIAFTEPTDEFINSWEFYYNNDEYIVNVIVE